MGSDWGQGADWEELFDPEGDDMDNAFDGC